MRVGEVGAVAPFRYSALVFAVSRLAGLGQLPDGPTWLGAGIVVAASAFTLYRQRRLAAPGQAPHPARAKPVWRLLTSRADSPYTAGHLEAACARRGSRRKWS